MHFWYSLSLYVHTPISLTTYYFPSFIGMEGFDLRGRNEPANQCSINITFQLRGRSFITPDGTSKPPINIADEHGVASQSPVPRFEATIEQGQSRPRSMTSFTSAE